MKRKAYNLKTRDCITMNQAAIMTPISDFLPPRGLRNPHLQTILSSMGPRQFKTAKHLAVIEPRQQNIILNGGNDIRLAGAFNQAGEAPSKRLAILIHGWEGSIKSSYIVSMTASLLAKGIDVFRLNMRDHGETHHLNEKIFNSTMVDEVIGAIEDLQRRMDYQHYHLIGFSLGGNFSLRVAALSKGREVRLDNTIVFCPVIHAKASNDVLNAPHNRLYSSYFVRKWKRSLIKKLEHFPDYAYASELASMKTLDEMNRKLIPVYTQFSDIEDYFDAYALSNELLSDTICPCYLHFAKDDMIIPVEGAEQLSVNANLNIVVTEHGGHCGFLKNWKFDSWQDQRALDIIESD